LRDSGCGEYHFFIFIAFPFIIASAIFLLPDVKILDNVDCDICILFPALICDISLESTNLIASNSGIDNSTSFNSVILIPAGLKYEELGFPLTLFLLHGLGIF